MLVYGDASRTEHTRDKLADIERRLSHIGGMPPGLERHGELVTAFIEAAELLQGIADAEFEERGADARSAATDAATALLMDLARAVGGSWSSGFTRLEAISARHFRRMEAAPLPESIRTKRGEGYAFYAVYPEGYFDAAKALQGAGAVRVIGIRSIGTGLAALVAVAAGAPVPVTVRPVGHPFRRALSLAPSLAAELTTEPDALFVIVDEGPGLSGSSFGAVADFLEARDVPPERIHFFPSHGGDLGPEAAPSHRERWSRAPRHIVDFDALVLRASDARHRLDAWFADLLGPPVEPLQDVSGGAWRCLRFSSEAECPAVHVQQERQKFLYRTAGGTWLLKFAGLGRDGPRKLERAKALHAAGFGVEVAGLRHGFLAERWHDEARPVDWKGANRTALLETMGKYLGFRARHFAAGPQTGGSLTDLLEMARRNTSLALGEEAAHSLDRWESQLSRLTGLERRIETDNRLHAWEWLRLPDGKLLKTDTVDHHASHDLVGCQDVAWDVAGARVEFDLTNEEASALCNVIKRESGRAVHPELLAFLTPCYLAFQLGYHTLAAESLRGWPAEADRLRAAAARYAARLRNACPR